MTFEQRCNIAAACLPRDDYRASLERLHAEMPAAIAAAPTPAQIGAAARVLNARCAIETGVNVDDCWKQYGDSFREDAAAMLDAAFKIGDAATKGKP